MVRCRVAALDDVKPGELKQVDAGGVPVCLARLESGEVYALSDICSHEEIELSDGELDGEDVECPAHGSRFNVRTGEVSGLPAEDPVATYRVTIEDEKIIIDV
jgi:3-phenylpropionate/trans-cinnamate dioxygenase ferredoxin component